MKFLTYILLLIGFLVTGVIATGTAMTFQWPGYILLGAAGLVSITLLFRWKIHGTSATCLLAGIGVTVFVIWRASTSPVVYFAREDAALVIACFCVYALVAVVFESSNWRMGLVAALVVLVVANLGLGVYQQVADMKRWVFDGYMRTYENRIGGVFNNPNHLAALLAMTVPVFLSVAFFGKNHATTVRLLLGFLSFLSLLAIGASKSRGGLLAAGVGLAVFAIIALPKIWQRLQSRQARVAVVSLVLFMTAMLGGITLLNMEMISERFGSAAFSKASEMNRPLMWRTALDQNAESPLFGTGSRTFYFFSRKLRSQHMHVSVPEADFAHNEYFQALADYGWVGLLTLVALMFFHINHGIAFFRKKRRFELETDRKCEDSGDETALTIGALAGLAAILIHAFFDFVLHIPVLALTTCIFLGILAVPGHVQEWRAGPQSNRRMTMGVKLLTRSICPGAGVALAVFGMIYARSEWHFEMARLHYESNSSNLEQLDHLRRARELDPQNPFAHSLGGAVHIALITEQMPIAVQNAYFKKAETHYRAAAELYPQDVFAAIGFAETLDANGKSPEAEKVLLRARKWAPLYGPVMQAQAEHWMHVGNIELAESYYNEAREAAAFRDWRAALNGLEKIAALRKLAVAGTTKHDVEPQPETSASREAFAERE